MTEWGLPPQIPWPRFLRLLRDPMPPRGWLEDAAEVPDLAKRPLLLRWIAQHPKASAHLRARLMPRMSMRALCQIAADAAAHPHARVQAEDRLSNRWPQIPMGERRALALLVPRSLWPLVWKTPDEGVLSAFLRHPRLSLQPLSYLIQHPLTARQAEALADSLWVQNELLAQRVLVLLDQALHQSDPMGLVLGHAVPWIPALGTQARLRAVQEVRHLLLRRLLMREWEDRD